MHPSQQYVLHGLDKYFNELVNLYNEKKLPSKILLTGKKGSGKATMAYHFINYVLSNFEENNYDLEKFTINEDNKSYRLLLGKSNPNFFLIDLIDEKKNIEINQIRQLINYLNKSNFNKRPRFILIDNIEYLNKNSTNALLKVIEEPNDDIYFLLIHNERKTILSTLKSRCLSFKINLSFNETINITNKLLNENLLKLINVELVNYYNSPGDFYNLINFSSENKINLLETNLIDLINILIERGLYKKNKFAKNTLVNYIELFFLKRYKLSDTKDIILNTYQTFVKKIDNANNFNLDEESLFMEFKSKMLNE